MCYLYGYIASIPTRIDCALVRVQQSLVRMSFTDSRNVPKASGWGAALFLDEEPTLQRKVISSPNDSLFDGDIASSATETAIAHVRTGTIGRPEQKNTQPFRHDSWAFAHHGTVENFHTLRRELMGELTPELRRSVQGGTDSEHVFYLFLSYLKRSAGSIAGDAPIHRIRDSMKKTPNMLNEWTERTGTRAQSRLVFLATNRRAFLACRQNGPLYFLERTEAPTCPVCDKPHAGVKEGQTYRDVVVATEPLSGEDWREIPDRSLLLVDPDLAMTVTPFDE